jgi:hypothetical protein
MPGSQPQPVVPVPEFWHSSSRIIETILEIYNRDGKEAAEDALNFARQVLTSINRRV